MKSITDHAAKEIIEYLAPFARIDQFGKAGHIEKISEIIQNQKCDCGEELHVTFTCKYCDNDE